MQYNIDNKSTKIIKKEAKEQFKLANDNIYLKKLKYNKKINNLYIGISLLTASCSNIFFTRNDSLLNVAGLVMISTSIGCAVGFTYENYFSKYAKEINNIINNYKKQEKIYITHQVEEYEQYHNTYQKVLEFYE